MKSDPTSTRSLRIFFLIGMIIFFIIFLNRSFIYTIFHLPKWPQFLYGLVTAILFFVASYIGNRKDFKKDVRLTGMVSLLPWCGLITMGFSIFLVSVNLERSMELQVIFLNYVLSGMSFLSVCWITLVYLHPQVMYKEPIVSPDPISSLPKNLQKLINEGKDAIAKTTINIVAIGVSAVMVSVFFLGSTKFPLAVLGVETLTVIIILIIARYFATYKWQKRAIQSGLPEKKLRSAMKLAGLPWINIKKE